jgi:hypothetical protein
LVLFLTPGHNLFSFPQRRSSSTLEKRIDRIHHKRKIRAGNDSVINALRSELLETETDPGMNSFCVAEKAQLLERLMRRAKISLLERIKKVLFTNGMAELFSEIDCRGEPAATQAKAWVVGPMFRPIRTHDEVTIFYAVLKEPNTAAVPLKFRRRRAMIKISSFIYCCTPVRIHYHGRSVPPSPSSLDAADATDAV